MNVGQLMMLLDADTSGTVTVDETVYIADLNVLDLGGKTVKITADPAIQIQGRYWSIRGGKLQATAGVLFECVSSSSGLIANVFASGLMRGKELFRCIGGNGCYDTNVIGGEWAKPADMLAPIIRVEVNGPTYNRNTWQGLRFQTNGRPQAPSVKLACTHSANWIYSNAFRDINFEIPNAGAIHLESCFQTTMDGIHVFDADMYGAITDDLVKVGKSPNGLKSKSTTVRNYTRLSGALSAGKVDINIGDVGHYNNNLIVEMVDGIDGAGLKVRLPEWVTQRCIRAQYVW